MLDEARVFPLITGSDGWVTQILSGGTGSTVRKGQPLISVYGREYTTAQRTFLYALRALDNSPQAPLGRSPGSNPNLIIKDLYVIAYAGNVM